MGNVRPFRRNLIKEPLTKVRESNSIMSVERQENLRTNYKLHSRTFRKKISLLALLIALGAKPVLAQTPDHTLELVNKALAQRGLQAKFEDPEKKIVQIYKPGKNAEDMKKQLFDFLKKIDENTYYRINYSQDKFKTYLRSLGITDYSQLIEQHKNTKLRDILNFDLNILPKDFKTRVKELKKIISNMPENMQELTLSDLSELLENEITEKMAIKTINEYKAEVRLRTVWKTLFYLTIMTQALLALAKSRAIRLKVFRTNPIPK